jgi:hypothetical protein
MILIYFILLALPLNINGKQKLVLIIVSFLITLLVTFTKNVIPPWQTALIIIALAGLSSIILGKRMKEKFDQNIAALTTSILSEDTSDLTMEAVEYETITTSQQMNALVKSKLEGIFPDSQMESGLDKLEYMQNEISEDLVASLPELDDFTEDITVEYTDISNVKLYEIEEMISMNEENLMFEAENTNSSEEISIALQADTKNNYLSDIEKLLLEEDNNSLVEQDKPATGNSQDNNIQLKEIKLEKLY